jgi:DeoR family transcriptional regulator, fructose operon transcriptional repressor
MKISERLDQICSVLEERDFMTIRELSDTFAVSEMTIRRDLERLDKENRLKKTFGGAVPLRRHANDSKSAKKPKGFLVDRVNVVIMPVVNPRHDNLLPVSTGNLQVPVIGESQAAEYAATSVLVDNYQAGFELGRRVGEYVNQHFQGVARVLDLTYQQANTQARSQGFMNGMREVIQSAELVLSLNAQSRYEAAFQLTRDALKVFSQINVIFGINDITSLGAIHACEDLQIDPERMLVVTFGLEGPTLRKSLKSCKYCKIGLAMFPEIVGATCIEAAIAVYNHQELPKNLLTPFAVLANEEIEHFYIQKDHEWQLNLETVRQRLPLPFDITQPGRLDVTRLPARIGFIQRFSEHEWYQTMLAAMTERAHIYGIELEIADAEQTLRDEVELRRRTIAQYAVKEVRRGETLLIDNGPIARYLAEQLGDLADITVITNSIPAFEILKTNPNIVLILTGGSLRRATQTLVGPSAESMLREIRASKLFLQAEGISLDFGLSHSNISEVTIKQQMIQSAQEVILLADYTCFGKDRTAQIAPLKAVDKLISDDGLPASFRIEISQKDIHMILAETGERES